ncbi:MAG: hypothetical protein ACRDSS_09025, partial [Actinocrinis sp.]
MMLGGSLLGASLLALALVVLAWSAPPAHAQGPVGPSVFYNVTYEGSATINGDGQASCAAEEEYCFNGPWHVTEIWSHWKVTFPAVQLSVVGATASAPAAGQELAWSVDSTDTYCPAGTADLTDFPCQAEHCTGDGPAVDPGAPDLMLTAAFADSALVLKVDAPWKPDPASATLSGDCGVAAAYPQFPDAFRAVTSIPVGQLDADTITRPVSSQDPGVYQLPPDCTAHAQADDSDITSCSESMLWSGTVTITPDCTSDAARVGGLAQPPCIKKKQKQEAQEAATQYGHDAQENHYTYKVNCTGLAGRMTKMDEGGKGFCLAADATYEYDASEQQAEQQIADDPPDQGFAHVARPHALKVGGLAPVRRGLPATYRLIARYLQIAGLESALVISQNRATGAFQSLSAGNTSAGADLGRQDKAVVRYASAAAGLLIGQPRLATKASAELRRVAAGLHGRGAHRAASAIRRFAAGLVSAQVAR